jgi:molybdate transport system substrate-binding protein
MPKITKFHMSLWLLFSFFLWFGHGCTLKPTHKSVEQLPEVAVAAASDLITAFSDIGERLQREKVVKAVFSFGSSGLLAKQIEAGAPFDIFAAASEAYVNRLQNERLILPESQQIFAQGRLVIWQQSDAAVKIEALEQLILPDIRRIAIANPEHAPYGLAAREALESAGLWQKVQSKTIFGENVLQTLQFAQTGNVDAAIVARSLASRTGGRFVLVNPKYHSPINQTICILRRTQQKAASQRFVEYLHSSEARAILESYGFKCSS